MDGDTADHDLLGPIMTSYLAQMDSAMKISKTISEHGNEEEISPDSLITGLIYRLMVPMEDNEIKESLDEAKNILSITSSDEDLDDEFGKGRLECDIDTTDDNDKVIINRVVKRNTCNCDLCIQCRVCLANYHRHEIHGDKLAQIFKDAIDSACKIHNISI
tara:strand:+ start:444 stop:926 length:483 start_codon:yes stop_codon:yes gene_type:complete